ncbi:MAG: MFS transporter [Rhodobacteraceae bacterium]|nr:MFS transporter [Erythrobacter sp.]MAY43731.1 MFS transporter [Paracoccaceae bacterium]|tara:strand:- start:10922 stop:12196 length:1275 start_codon:yes stop_codon:yes gene_type:complete
MTAATPTWFGQPRGLTILFLTNMWEQFSYYGMRTLLVYYMTKQLLLGQQWSSFVYGTYTACAYFTPIVGGVIADRLLGRRRAIMIGGSIMALGHFMMASEPLFYVALATIALGNGLFLPSLPSQIDSLYDAADPRRGWAYNVYYVGVNVGGFLAPLICGTLGETLGWHWGFGAAGLGMVSGLIIYSWGRRYLPPEPARETATREKTRGFDGQMVAALAAVAIAVTIFRGAYEQVGNTIALWSDTGVDRSFGDVTIPMTWFQSLNSLFVMAFTPLLLLHWRRKAAKGLTDSAVRRMSKGALIVAGAYAMIGALSLQAGADLVGWAWLALFFVVLTVGELYILPTGLSLFARLAPPGYGATTVAAWFLAIFTGSMTAGLVGTLWSRMEPGPFFFLLAGIAGAAALLLRLMDPLVTPVEMRGSAQKV